MGRQAAIAKMIDDLGDQFCPAMREGWLAYITKTNPSWKKTVCQGPALGERDLVVEDDDN